jgi:type I restriction enzyme, S subunit
MPDWRTETVADCLVRLPLATMRKLQTQDYRPSGRYPIIDQGQTLIVGWTDDESGLITQNLPVVVFGDHTRALKFVDFPFVRGADGTQILRPKAGIDPLFFYYALRAVDLPGRGYNRHFKALKEKEISVPTDSEQSDIAGVLKLVEDTLNLQDKELRAWERTKRATMRALFSRGLRSEAPKETEIGAIPESWDVTAIGDVASNTQYGLSVRGEPSGAYPILRMNCQEDGAVHYRNLQYVDLDPTTYETFRLRPGDLLFNRTNSIELVGRMAIVDDDQPAVFASYLVRLTVDSQRCLPRFLNYFMNWPATQDEIKKLASRAVGQANINASKLRTVLFPLPPTLDEQKEIVAILDAIDRKTDLHKRKRVVLDDLFKSLLHKLMTGEIHVGDLDLSALKRSKVPKLAA